jgi:hypothetical protein
MGLYRDEGGLVFEMDDDFAEARGYSPVDPVEEQSIYTERGLQLDADGGALGTLHAGAVGMASGMTLGMSDVLLSQGLSEEDREALVRELDAHPVAHAGGEIGGTVIASMGGMPRTPTGYLSSLAQREAGYGLAQGGVKGTAKALGAMGAEGSIQSAGSYIGHSALEDKEVTAEGLAGALGAGYAQVVLTRDGRSASDQRRRIEVVAAEPGSTRRRRSDRTIAAVSLRRDPRREARGAALSQRDALDDARGADSCFRDVC